MTDESAAVVGRVAPRKNQLLIGGLTLFGGGGCLMWTVILIPLAIPLALIGLVMMVRSFFVPTEPMQCPACQATNLVESTVPAFVCPHCQKSVTRTPEGWRRVD